MKVPLYGMFGDNFVIALASQANNVKRVDDGLEVDERELKEAVLTASQLAEDRERRGKFEFPRYGNDRNAYFSTLKCYGIPENAKVSETLRIFANSLDKECDEVTPISILKPEFYEYIRSPGTPRKGGTKVKVGTKYIMLAMAGWVFSRLGRLTFKEGEYVSVYAFPPDVDHSFGAIPSLLKELGDSLPGVEPITALIIWLASKMVKSGAVIDQMLLYFVADPISSKRKNSPAVIKSGHLVSFERIVKNNKFWEVREDAELLAEYALKQELLKQCNLGSFGARVINLLFEVLSGSKNEVELRYFANRELFSSMNSTSIDPECLEAFKAASRIADKLVS